MMREEVMLTNYHEFTDENRDMRRRGKQPIARTVILAKN